MSRRITRAPGPVTARVPVDAAAAEHVSRSVAPNMASSEASHHPARFNDRILRVIAEQVGPGRRVLDPFAGTGRIHELAHVETVGIELEPEWAVMHPRTIVGNALSLPFRDGSFDTIATSPCYGNRYADHHNARDGSVRRSYTHDLRKLVGDPARQLHPDNAGLLHWGPTYRNFHERAWRECVRVLRPGGSFVLNISDHVRRGVLQPVTAWQLATLTELGLQHCRSIDVPTARMRFGANGSVRANFETIAVFAKAVG